MSFFTKVSKSKANNKPLRSPIELILQSFQLYRSNFWLMVGYTSWLLFPFAGYFLLSFFPEQSPIVFTLSLICSVIEFTITFWVGIILVLLVNAVTEKQPFDPAAIKKQSAALLQPTARVLLLHLLIVIAGFVLLIIPGIVALGWFAFAQTSVILDGKRNMQALTFSKTLSEGRFFQVLYRLLSGPILIGFVYSFVIAILLAFSLGSSGLDPAKITAETQLPAWLDLLQSIVEIFTIPLLATYMTLLYKHLVETSDPSSSMTPSQDDKGKDSASGNLTR